MKLATCTVPVESISRELVRPIAWIEKIIARKELDYIDGKVTPIARRILIDEDARVRELERSMLDTDETQDELEQRKAEARQMRAERFATHMYDPKSEPYTVQNVRLLGNQAKPLEQSAGG